MYQILCAGGRGSRHAFSMKARRSVRVSSIYSNGRSSTGHPYVETDAFEYEPVRRLVKYEGGGGKGKLGDHALRKLHYMTCQN